MPDQRTGVKNEQQYEALEDGGVSDERTAKAVAGEQGARS